MVKFNYKMPYLLHYIKKYNENEYKILFLIFNQISIDKLKFKYKIYTAETKDFINFYNTQELQINNFKDWATFCYNYTPIFYNELRKNLYYVVIRMIFAKSVKFPIILNNDFNWIKFKMIKICVDFIKNFLRLLLTTPW